MLMSILILVPARLQAETGMKTSTADFPVFMYSVLL
jgi:hypothetical protein